MANKVFLIGNLGKDPEIKYLQSGTALCKFSIAVSEKVKRGDSWEDHTEWINITCWGRLGEICGQYLSKGAKVHIEGKTRRSKYTDRDGNEKESFEVHADRVEFLSPRGGKRYEGTTQGPPTTNTQAPSSVNSQPSETVSSPPQPAPKPSPGATPVSKEIDLSKDSEF